jgi:hypothetical protein
LSEALKNTVISEISALALECSEPNWDAYGARPMSPIAASRAVELILALPDGIPLPEVAADPDGSVSLDWISSRRRTLSLNVGESTHLAYAWIDGTDRGYAVEIFNEHEVPAPVLDAIRSTMGVRHAPIRPS